MKKNVLFTLLFIGVILIGVVGGVFLSRLTSQNGTDTQNTEEVFRLTGERKTFDFLSQNHKFFHNGEDNPEIRVAWGDVVIINLQSSIGFHDWVLEEYTVATQRVNPGQSTSVEFIADKKGRFAYYCSVGTHRENGMEGILVVE